MSLDATLQSNNITAMQAWEFISNNLSAPELIYAEAQSAGLSTTMLTELVTRFDSSIDTAEVNQYFAGAGLDPFALGASTGGSPTQPAPNSEVSFNAQGNVVIQPSAPLNDEQLIFVAGLIEASFLGGDPVNTTSADSFFRPVEEGFLIDVKLGNRDYQDLIINLSQNDIFAMDSLATPLIEEVYSLAAQNAGFASLDSWLSQPASVAQDQQVYANAEAQIVPFIQPQYDALLAGQSDLWG